MVCCMRWQAVCVNDYFICSYQSQTAPAGGQCACTKRYIYCMTEGGCDIAKDREPLSGFSAYDL